MLISKEININGEHKLIKEENISFHEEDGFCSSSHNDLTDIHSYKERCKELEKALMETRSALDDFQITSKEFEDALEQELEHTEKQYQALKEKNLSLQKEVERWKA
ncbi:unnamed protein product [Pneumocystis jirovecii]|uniref:NUDE domain-containing protein n=1 Tax=Pneumocystis jirovecii TaxID=42068 RepID=L0PH00_PNEJI|nr:unnamed protein product [Pneumocystis jirovecii]